MTKAFAIVYRINDMITGDVYEDLTRAMVAAQAIADTYSIQVQVRELTDVTI